ncbi:hypothetical protein [Phycicoccus ginsengisoli]
MPVLLVVGDGTVVGGDVAARGEVGSGTAGADDRDVGGAVVPLRVIVVVPVPDRLPDGVGEPVADDSGDVLLTVGTAGTEEGGGPGRSDGRTSRTRATTASAVRSTRARAGVRTRRCAA